MIGVVAAVLAVGVAVIIVFAASNRGEERTGVFGPGGSPSTTASPRVPGSGSSRSTTTAAPGDDSGAVFSTCTPIAQPFPIGARTCTIVRPPEGTGAARLPAVVLLHGWNTTPSQVLANGAWADAVMRHGLLVAAPDGLFGGWNAGGCCGISQATQIDDTAFLQQVVAQLRSRRDVDPDRIYAVGESNGGMMVHRFLCVGADTVAGAASVGGTPVAGCTPNAPVPILEVHGTADMTVPYRGGQSAISWVLGVTFPAVESALPTIAEAEGCSSSPAMRTSGSVRTTDWSGCRDGVPLRLVTIEGGAHAWFRDGTYDSTEEILRFFGLAS